MGILLNIVITGGAGFIGSRLCEVLSKKREVVWIDNLLTDKEAMGENYSAP